MVMDKTGNFLAMMVQDKMRRNSPQNVMAQKELDFVNANPNYLKDQYDMKQKQQRLQYEKDVMDWGVKSLNFISPEEYPQFRETAISYGMNPSILPEGFDSPEAFQEFKTKVAIGAPEYKELIAGGKANFHVVDEKGIERDLGEMTQAEAQALVKSGQIPPDGLRFGKAQATEKKQYDHKPVYNAAGKLIGYKSIEKGKDFTFGEGEFGNAPDASKSTDPTPQQALKRISDIQKARATLDKSSEVTQMLAALNPELKGMVGQQIAPELKQQLNDAWDNEINYLQQFTAKKETGALPSGLTQEMLDQYKAKYPDKTEDQIKEAWKNRIKQ